MPHRVTLFPIKKIFLGIHTDIYSLISKPSVCFICSYRIHQGPDIVKEGCILDLESIWKK